MDSRLFAGIRGFLLLSRSRCVAFFRGRRDDGGDRVGGLLALPGDLDGTGAAELAQLAEKLVLAFDLDEDFVANAEEGEDYDRFIDRVDRRKQAVKKGKAAWSKLEDVLAEKRLQKELKDFYEEK